jgi:hypothetical protein
MVTFRVLYSIVQYCTVLYSVTDCWLSCRENAVSFFNVEKTAERKSRWSDRLPAYTLS